MLKAANLKTDRKEVALNDRMQDKQDAPLFELRDGNLRSATWQRDGEYGPQHSTKLSKIYKDQDGSYRETNSFNPKELLRVGELARETHHEILKRKREHSKERFTEGRKSPADRDGSSRRRDSRAR